MRNIEPDFSHHQPASGGSPASMEEGVAADEEDIADAATAEPGIGDAESQTENNTERSAHEDDKEGQNENGNEESRATVDATARDRAYIKRREWGRDLRLAMACIAGTVESGRQPGGEQPEGSEQPESDDEGGIDSGDDTEASSLSDICRKLHQLTRQIDGNIATQVELLVRFDELEGWRERGARNCVAWMHTELGMERKLSWERLRVGRAIRSLPVMRALFRKGELSWSKVRLLSRIATPELERDLAYLALDASVSDIERVCQEFRWGQKNDPANAPSEGGESDGSDSDNAPPEGDEGNGSDRGAADGADGAGETGGTTASEQEDRLAFRQHEQRRCSWRQLPDGMTEVRVLLPPLDAQNVLKSLDHCEDQIHRASESTDDTSEIDPHSTPNANSTSGPKASPNAHGAEPQADSYKETSDTTPPTALQRRADALVHMAERSLAFGGTDVLRADRFQVVVSAETDTLIAPSAADGLFPSGSASRATRGVPLPERRAVVEGIGPIARSTARRVACDANSVNIETRDGEPVSIGRRSRIWPAAMRRAIIARDRHCQFDGCDVDRHLQIHHLVHWADGGDTSIENGVCVCHHHHALIHEGGFRIERATIAIQTGAGPNQGTPLGLESRIKRELLPSRCRFRTVKPAMGSTSKQPCACHTPAQEVRENWEPRESQGDRSASATGIVTNWEAQPHRVDEPRAVYGISSRDMPPATTPQAKPTKAPTDPTDVDDLNWHTFVDQLRVNTCRQSELAHISKPAESQHELTI